MDAPTNPPQEVASEGEYDERQASENERELTLDESEAEGNSGGDNDGSSHGSNGGDDDDGDDNDDPSSSGSESDAKGGVVTTSDGRVLSRYELQREERIRRNREYLASLGLEKPVGEADGAGRGQQPQARRKNKRRPVPEKQRSSLRERKSVDYSEPSTTVASIVRASKTDALQRKAKATKAARKEESQSKTPLHKDKDARMERFIYREFQRIQARKSHVLKQAEKDLKAAKREVKYWSKLVEKAESREKRREESSHHAEHGVSLREAIRVVDNRTSELVDAVGRYDEELHAEEKVRERQLMRLEAENKLETIHALERFPLELKECQALLDAALLERAPEDPPPPRRSHRAPREEAAGDVAESPKASKVPVKCMEGDELGAMDDLGSAPDAFVLSTAVEVLKSVPKNVGGWVSPPFAAQLDRSWLDRDAPPTRFDPSTFVPQIGDCVLYYPIGHKNHLRYFPDALGKQTGNASRVPLWERGTDRAADDETSNMGWLPESWLSSMENDDWSYPILCRVEGTCPEFPPDPYVKVVENTTNDGDEEVVRWEAPKGASVQKRLSGTPLCLAVELRPLTPLVPCDASSGRMADLSPPPPFSIVTFPTELDPFLLPFAWAYATNCLSIGEHFTHKDDEDSSTLRLEEFAFLDGNSQTCRLEQRMGLVADTLSLFEESASKRDVLKTLLVNAPPAFPMQEGRNIIAVLRKAKRDTDDAFNDRDPTRAVDLFKLVLETLPLWNSAAVVKIANKRKQRWVSPWLLVPRGQLDLSQEFTPEALLRHASSLPVSLRSKIALMLDDVWSRFEDSDWFYYDVSESEEPSYGCAVPVMMSFEKIIRRLGVGNQSYYRSADEVLSDASMIWENCLLYNSPHSPVVDSGIEIVSELKEAIFRTTVSHFEEHQRARQCSERRRRLLSRTARHEGDPLVDGQAPTPLSLSLLTVLSPHKDEVDDEWLQQVFPPGDTTPSTFGLRFSEPQTCRVWFPQAGDHILYSIENHKAFLRGHATSLDPLQSRVPDLNHVIQPVHNSDQENISSYNCSWIPGTVLWVKAAFPRERSKKYLDDLTPVTILALGIRFESATNTRTSVLYWRPCAMDCEKAEVGDTSCSVCGVRLSSSFLRLCRPASTELSEPLASSIERCLNVLKRRCIKQENLKALDPSLTMENVMNGYSTPLVRLGPKSLPSYTDMLSPQPRSISLVTRGTDSHSETDPSLLHLVELGFLPRWLSSLPDVMDKDLKRFRMVSPCPKLSLELILNRIGQRFYRQKAAIENDIVEAYINQVAFLLADSASRRKSPVSMRRIARGLTLVDDAVIGDTLDSLEALRSAEELEFLKRSAKIRDLHAMALFATYEPSHFERLLGSVQGKASTTDAASHASATSALVPARVCAREEIETLLSAVAKDLVQRSSNRALKTRIVIRCQGEVVPATRYFATAARTEALVGGSSKRIKVVCCGKVFTTRHEVFEASYPVQDGSHEVSVPLLNEMKVKVTCNGSLFGDHRLAAMIPGRLGDNALARVVETSIRCSRSEFEESSTLVRFLVGQPGRMDRCARCQAYQRSFYYCRVVRGHLNEDFDLAGFFANGVNRIDELLQTLHPSKLSSANDPASVVQAPGCDVVLMAGEASEHPLAEVDCSGSKAREPQGWLIGDTRSNLEKARTAVSLASQLMHDAELYNEAPARFSQDFVSKSFPIDPSDGHYVYCVVCGLSGDLLCCDGCSNVVHQDCVSLPDLPEGDWFCDECIARKLPKDAASKDEKPLHPPFGRVDFDDARAERLAQVLVDLYEARPDQRAGRTAKQEDVDADDISTRPPGRPPQNQKDDEHVHDDTEFDDCETRTRVPLKRRRGRPRKHFVESDPPGNLDVDGAASVNDSLSRGSPVESSGNVEERSIEIREHQSPKESSSRIRSLRVNVCPSNGRNPTVGVESTFHSGRRTTRSDTAGGKVEDLGVGAVKYRERRRSWRRAQWPTEDEEDVDLVSSPEPKRRKTATREIESLAATSEKVGPDRTRPSYSAIWKIEILD